MNAVFHNGNWWCPYLDRHRGRRNPLGRLFAQRAGLDPTGFHCAPDGVWRKLPDRQRGGGDWRTSTAFIAPVPPVNVECPTCGAVSVIPL